MPHLADIRTTLRLLAGLGVQESTNKRWLDGADELSLHADHIEKFEAPYDLVKTMRASFLVLGPLLARFGQARVSTPGGCAIGARPIDLHLKGLEAMGARHRADPRLRRSDGGAGCAARKFISICRRSARPKIS